MPTRYGKNSKRNRQIIINLLNDMAKRGWPDRQTFIIKRYDQTHGLFVKLSTMVYQIDAH